MYIILKPQYEFELNYNILHTIFWSLYANGSKLVLVVCLQQE